MECYDDSQDCCDRVGVSSSGILQNTYPEILDTEYLFYTGLLKQDNTVSVSTFDCRQEW